MKLETVYLASSRPSIGDRCLEWLQEEQKRDDHRTFSLVNSLDEASVVISVLYDTIFTPEFLHDRRCYNFHPGILPEYRGAGAFSWAIINRENVSGITLHEIDGGIDRGDIIDIQEFPIGSEDTAEELFDRGMGLVFSMLQLWLYPLLHNFYATEPNVGGHFYNRVDLEQERDLTRFLRAFTFDGKPNAFYRDSEGICHELKRHPQ